MTRTRRRLLLIALAGIVAVAAVSWTLDQLFPYTDAKARQIRRLFRYAKREIGGPLEGVKLRFPSDLELVVVSKGSGVLAEKLYEGHMTWRDQLAWGREVAAANDLKAEDVVVDCYGLGGVYSPREKLIRLSRLDGLELRIAGEEIGHAALGVPHQLAPPDARKRARNLDEAFAAALGGIELVAQFLAAEGSTEAEEIEKMRTAMYARLWRRAEDADPLRGFLGGAPIEAERYRHSDFVRDMVDEIVEMNVPLAEKFRLAREKIKLHALIVE